MSSSPSSKADQIRACLDEALKQRVMVMDGAMGTMIQSYALTEKDFRGDRFGNLEGNLQATTSCSI